MTTRRVKKWGIVWGCIALIAIMFSIILAYGNTVPGGLFERSNYAAKAYILLFQSESDTKNYRIVGSIEKYNGIYRVDEAYWPSGASIKFDDCYQVTLTSRTYCSAGEASYWVQLTSESAR